MDAKTKRPSPMDESFCYSGPEPLFTCVIYTHQPDPALFRRGGSRVDLAHLELRLQERVELLPELVAAMLDGEPELPLHGAN